MKIIACVDNSLGILFNHRRQSSDSAVIQDICSSLDGGKLWTSIYSGELFPEDKITADDDFISRMGREDSCFLESVTENGFIDANADLLVLYYWNQKYPHDSFLNVDLGLFTMISEEDLYGSSHDRITRRIYRHRGGQ